MLSFSFSLQNENAFDYDSHYYGIFHLSSYLAWYFGSFHISVFSLYFAIDFCSYFLFQAKFDTMTRTTTLNGEGEFNMRCMSPNKRQDKWMCNRYDAHEGDSILVHVTHVFSFLNLVLTTTHHKFYWRHSNCLTQMKYFGMTYDGDISDEIIFSWIFLETCTQILFRHYSFSTQSRHFKKIFLRKFFNIFSVNPCKRLYQTGFWRWFSTSLNWTFRRNSRSNSI